MRKPWNRLPQETAPAFEAFGVYRDMASGRSLANVGRDLEKHKTLIERWSSRWGWVERAAAWDHHLDDRKLEVAVDEVEERTRRHLAATQAMQGIAVRTLRSLQLGEKELTPTEARRYMEAAIRLERLIIGEPDSHAQVEIQMGGAVQRVLQAVLQEVTDPEVRSRIADRLRVVSSNGDE